MHELRREGVLQERGVGNQADRLSRSSAARERGAAAAPAPGRRVRGVRVGARAGPAGGARGARGGGGGVLSRA